MKDIDTASWCFKKHHSALDMFGLHSREIIVSFDNGVDVANVSTWYFDSETDGIEFDIILQDPSLILIFFIFHVILTKEEKEQGTFPQYKVHCQPKASGCQVKG